MALQRYTLHKKCLKCSDVSEGKTDSLQGETQESYSFSWFDSVSHYTNKPSEYCHMVINNDHSLSTHLK